MDLQRKGVKMCDWIYLTLESVTWPAIVVNFVFLKGHRVTILSSVTFFRHNFVN